MANRTSKESWAESLWISMGLTAVVFLPMWGLFAWERHQVESMAQSCELETIARIEKAGVISWSITDKGSRVETRLDEIAPGDRVCKKGEAREDGSFFAIKVRSAKESDRKKGG